MLGAVDGVGQHRVHRLQGDPADVIDVEPTQLGDDRVGRLPRHGSLDDVTGAVHRDAAQQHHVRGADLPPQGLEHGVGPSVRDDHSQMEHVPTISPRACYQRSTCRTSSRGWRGAGLKSVPV